MDLGIQNIEEVASGNLSEKDKAFVMSADGSRELKFGASDGGPIELQAFNTHRQIAAQKLGMEFFNMGEEALSEFQDRGTYNGIFMDAVIVVYLCINPISTAKKSLRIPSQIQSDALSWAEKNGIQVGSENHAELIETFGEILGDIMESVSEIDTAGLSEGGQSLGESSETLPNISDSSQSPPKEPFPQMES